MRHGRVSRGNKFRQIVLPALYTVAHEVERVRASPSPSPLLPVTPRDRCPPSLPAATAASASHCGYVHPRLLRVKETCALCPPERKRCHFLPVFLAPCQSSPPPPPPFAPFPTLLVPLFSRPCCSLDTLARYQPSSLYSANVFPIFLLRSTGALVRSQRPPIAALACSNASAPRFSCLKFRSYPHLQHRVVSPIFPH